MTFHVVHTTLRMRTIVNNQIHANRCQKLKKNISEQGKRDEQ